MPGISRDSLNFDPFTGKSRPFVATRVSAEQCEFGSCKGKGSAVDSLVEIVDEFLPAYTPVVE